MTAHALKRVEGGSGFYQCNSLILVRSATMISSRVRWTRM